MTILGLTWSGTTPPDGMTVTRVGPLSLVCARQRPSDRQEYAAAVCFCHASLEAFLPLRWGHHPETGAALQKCDEALDKLKAALRTTEGAAEISLGVTWKRQQAAENGRDWLSWRGARRRALVALEARARDGLAPATPRSVDVFDRPDGADLSLLCSADGLVDRARALVEDLKAFPLPAPIARVVATAPWPAFGYAARLEILK